MKNTCLLLSAIVILFGSSCRKYCSPRPITEIEFQSNDSITDNKLRVDKYDKATGFSKLISSSESTIGVYYRPGEMSHGSAGGDLTDAGYNYRITLLPSGQVYDITELSYGHEKSSSGYGGGNTTKCSFSYKVNGENGGSGAYQEDGNGGNYGWIEL